MQLVCGMRMLHMYCVFLCVDAMNAQSSRSHVILCIYFMGVFIGVCVCVCVCVRVAVMVVVLVGWRVLFCLFVFLCKMYCAYVLYLSVCLGYECSVIPLARYSDALHHHSRQVKPHPDVHVLLLLGY